MYVDVKGAAGFYGVKADPLGVRLGSGFAVRIRSAPKRQQKEYKFLCRVSFLNFPVAFAATDAQDIHHPNNRWNRLLGFHSIVRAQLR